MSRRIDRPGAHYFARFAFFRRIARRCFRYQALERRTFFFTIGGITAGAGATTGAGAGAGAGVDEQAARAATATTIRDRKLLIATLIERVRVCTGTRPAGRKESAAIACAARLNRVWSVSRPTRMLNM